MVAPVQLHNRQRLLIVEDHKDLAENLFEYLGEDNYDLDFAGDGLTALHLLANHYYDVVILDVMLPGVDGFTICRRIRQDIHSSVPVILLTARDSIEDKDAGFSAGADDYLVKPFHMRELELRIQALCRRNRSQSDHLIAKDVSYTPGTLTVSLSDKTRTTLSGYSATIFETLIRQYPEFVSYQDLSNSLWGNPDGDPHTIRTHVYALRKTLKSSLGRDMIKTLHSRGYVLQPDGKLG
ncbi:two-component system response regulator [Hahella sp. CCB-MM4]|uniref:response regulator transcription factor n=1 Tax=Hahella sp. (strain CCB-MM4) TaxID=1926491 RepID=UPI000B9C10F5|nr:response regulator transcription factor [Hahella sp. CCB-MM4]OZG75412.1 two-component system response regulator [Hahella sp. CCB-MM4]